MSSGTPTIVIIADTSVLINLSHTGHFSFLARTPGLEFVVCDEVLAEITIPEQNERIKDAVAAGWIRQVSIADPAELTAYAELSQKLGSGESSCLAIAACRRWVVACDEKRVFLRHARELLGADQILNTPGLYLLWIRAGLLTIAEADAAKEILKSRRFRLPFRSFGEIV